MGRKPLGESAMSGAERQRRYQAQFLRQQDTDERVSKQGEEIKRLKAAARTDALLIMNLRQALNSKLRPFTATEFARLLKAVHPDRINGASENELKTVTQLLLDRKQQLVKTARAGARS